MPPPRCRISIALCTHNAGRFLEYQLDSIGRQSWPPDEIVVCDDASADSTVEIVRAFAAASSAPVKLRVNASPLGSARNFEQALSHCTGEIICLAEQNCPWNVNRTERLLECFGDDSVGLAFSDALMVHEDLSPVGCRLWEAARFDARQQRRVRRGNALPTLLQHPMALGSMLAFRAKYLPLILPIPDVSHAADLWIAMLIASVSRVVPVDEDLVRYRLEKTNHGGQPQRDGPGKIERSRGWIEGNDFARAADLHEAAYRRLVSDPARWPVSPKNLELLQKTRRQSRFGKSLPSGSFYLLDAVCKNLRSALLGKDRRPSIALGIKLLLRGRWNTFRHQLLAYAWGGSTAASYDLWQQRNRITPRARQEMQQEVAKWNTPPTISVILPVYNVPEVFLRRCIESVIGQIYPHWELCIADDASSEPHVKQVLAEYAANHPRIKVVYRETNGNISAASNSALELAGGPYAALLDHDDELAEHALFRVAEAIVRDPALDMIYSDEDKLTPEGKRFDPFFKPDWSPEYFLACNYICHLGVYRTERLRQIGGWRGEFDGAQDYDLVLRFIAGNPKIAHIPDVLYHWRAIATSAASRPQAKPEAYHRARRALQAYLNASGRTGHVETGPSEGFHRIRYEIKGNPKVSIVIPSACRPEQFRGRPSWHVLKCVSSIRRLSTYRNLEIIVSDNNDMSDELGDALKPYEVRRIPYLEPFNLARKLNQGVFSARGEQVILLNDNVEVISKDWIESMLEFSQWPEIGAVGAQLLFPNNTQQHTGMTLLQGNPRHPFYQFPAEHPGYFLSSKVHRNWSAVTGACMMTRAEVFKSVGGFSEDFPPNYNDVDYCLKVMGTGRRIVYMPHARLYYHESVTKSETCLHQLEKFKETWLERFPLDPYYNPNLTMWTCDFRIG